VQGRAAVLYTDMPAGAALNLIDPARAKISTPK
jgi:hypothetical protein